MAPTLQLMAERTSLLDTIAVRVLDEPMLNPRPTDA
jgi:hypothetical protein